MVWFGFYFGGEREVCGAFPRQCLFTSTCIYIFVFVLTKIRYLFSGSLKNLKRKAHIQIRYLALLSYNPLSCIGESI